MKRGIEAIDQGIRRHIVDRSKYKPGTCFEPNKIKFHSEEEVAKAAKNMAEKRGHPLYFYHVRLR